jgi:DNA polymerase III alpha subunit
MSEEAHKDPVRLEHAPFYAELAAATNYSFLRGASHPSDMVARALELGMSGIGIADRNTVAGVVRAHAALKEARAKAMATGLPDPDFRLVVGARLVFADGTPDILAYPATRFGWYFLTVHDIVRFARDPLDPPILCQGRGAPPIRNGESVCYLLGITSVDPNRRTIDCCSSASSPKSARSRPTSTSISSMSGARR